MSYELEDNECGDELPLSEEEIDTDTYDEDFEEEE